MLDGLRQASLGLGSQPAQDFLTEFTDVFRADPDDQTPDIR
jgi:hypothetical protein